MSRIQRIDRPDGSYEYRKDGQWHREDGPAIESAAGDKWWFRDGQLHREGGPAVEHATGSKWWYRNGLLHREDGPAYEGADGTKAWYLKGKSVPPPSPPSTQKPPRGPKIQP